jgi:uncharacterized membrane protein YphA (DoxX/SURF4 family)
MKRLYELVHFPYCHGWAIAILRVVTGIVFFAHGYKKLFVDRLGGFAGFLSQIGIPAANFLAPLVAGVELFGGLALILGLLTPLGGDSTGDHHARRPSDRSPHEWVLSP